MSIRHNVGRIPHIQGIYGTAQKNRYAEEDIQEITDEGYTGVQQSEKRVSKER
ncbi:MAG: hypothetical protein JO297_12955 [Nitrososphaeraceae archaeon]|nr:hypothetical protein [Nitrososphaeraceae archaeon]